MCRSLGPNESRRRVHSVRSRVFIGDAVPTSLVWLTRSVVVVVGMLWLFSAQEVGSTLDRMVLWVDEHIDDVKLAIDLRYSHRTGDSVFLALSRFLRRWYHTLYHIANHGLVLADEVVLFISGGTTTTRFLSNTSELLASMLFTAMSLDTLLQWCLTLVCLHMAQNALCIFDRNVIGVLAAALEFLWWDCRPRMVGENRELVRRYLKTQVTGFDMPMRASFRDFFSVSRGERLVLEARSRQALDTSIRRRRGRHC